MAFVSVLLMTRVVRFNMLGFPANCATRKRPPSFSDQFGTPKSGSIVTCGCVRCRAKRRWADMATARSVSAQSGGSGHGLRACSLG
ncbi:hypothetical protein RUM8411_00903 [Ruegeria meonggei]|uniref:Uncharacterized protein n=1 Tax=Ruegeria meonggei TaxID=1446476 RepID=A0A1X6YLR6_9RHOB|nr:hypothetical protein RUM8411_00903 [Ruegeria meonggei]